ncbi:unnamed protein product [Lampetra fluviatilis]
MARGRAHDAPCLASIFSDLALPNRFRLPANKAACTGTTTTFLAGPNKAGALRGGPVVILEPAQRLFKRQRGAACGECPRRGPIAPHAASSPTGFASSRPPRGFNKSAQRHLEDSLHRPRSAMDTPGSLGGAPIVWNSLPNGVRAGDSLHLHKSKLKSLVFSSASGCNKHVPVVFLHSGLRRVSAFTVSLSSAQGSVNELSCGPACPSFSKQGAPARIRRATQRGSVAADNLQDLLLDRSRLPSVGE